MKKPTTPDPAAQAPKGSGNRSTRRGHRAKGSHTNPATPATFKLLRELGDFLADVRAAVAPARAPRHLSLKCCARECGISHGSLRHYLAGTYVPAPAIVPKLRAWLKRAKAVAETEGASASR